MKSSISTSTLAVLSGISLISQATAQVTIDWVTVGNAGNAADTTGYGAVGYNYAIGKYETTIAQYTVFLNAVAKSDPYGLYNPLMGTDPNSAGISRTGSLGNYSYSVIGSSGNRPITYVNWFDAARFTNWLHNGQGSGDTETGAYTLNGATSGIITKNAGAQVWIPSENEWYKAAYYDPTKNGGAGGYWLHANRSNTMTSNNIGVAGAANYFAEDFATTPGIATYSETQNYLTDVGAYGANSASYYGTYDQGGNVWEWNDEVNLSLERGLRGASWYPTFDGANNLASSNRYMIPEDIFDYSIGFRVASVPEPSGLVLTMLIGAGFVCHRRRSL
jgi:formylglycine-generating enzyme required for sulfatase activity